MGESIQMVFFRFVAALILVGLLAVVGFNVYNAGVSAGIASDVGNAIASGAPVPAGYYYGPYAGGPWHGFGFGGFLLGLLFLSSSREYRGLVPCYAGSACGSAMPSRTRRLMIGGCGPQGERKAQDGTINHSRVAPHRHLGPAGGDLRTVRVLGGGT